MWDMHRVLMGIGSNERPNKVKKNKMKMKLKLMFCHFTPWIPGENAMNSTEANTNPPSGRMRWIHRGLCEPWVDSRVLKAISSSYCFSFIFSVTEKKETWPSYTTIWMQHQNQCTFFSSLGFSCVHLFCILLLGHWINIYPASSNTM